MTVSERQFSFTLTGAEWFAILAALESRVLTPLGRKTLRLAKRKLLEQALVFEALNNGAKS